jgi:hypothetical protein
VNFFSSLLESSSALLASDSTVLAVQIFLGLSACGLVFLVLFTTRDILMRTNSFLYQIACILLVALLPVVGFLMYVLIRPSRTLAERAMHANIIALLTKLHAGRKLEQKPMKK